ncbi:MAG: alpha/beta fold hydrolase [Pseudomonadota bacterium]
MAFLHYSSQGTGSPLVILHGLFGSGKNWQSLARKFSASYQVICVDLRNHGQSFHVDSMNYDLMACDVIDLLNELNIGPCCLMGHSMGGKVAMTVALKAPALLSKLVVVDIAPVAYDHQYDKRFGLMPWII